MIGDGDAEIRRTVRSRLVVILFVKSTGLFGGTNNRGSLRKHLHQNLQSRPQQFCEVEHFARWLWQALCRRRFVISGQQISAHLDRH
jgi:hypothetical protein